MTADKVEDDSAGEKPRARWGSHVEFLLAGIGLAVGTGNVWRFPYLAQKNGGGAFLIPYFVMLLVEGLPLFFLELALGQRFQKGSIAVWKQIRPYLKGIGIAQVIVSFNMVVYYPIVMTWCGYYFYLSFMNPLPWTKCDNTTADYECCKNDSSKYYWYVSALQATTSISEPGGFVTGVIISWTVGWVITYACLFKGPESTGKAAYFTATFPYIVLICLFFRGVTLPGAGRGLAVFFTPDFSKLVDPNVWVDAAGQIFFSLSVGFGSLICFASYNPIKNNCVKDAFFISVINCGTSVFSGVVVYSILGYRETQTKIKVEDVDKGPGLAFIAYTTAVAEMPLSQLWSAAFFIMMMMLALNSEFGSIEACVTPLKDQKALKGVKREILCLILCCIMYIVGLPMCMQNGLYVFTLWDNYAVTIPLLFVGACECLAVSWLYGLDRFNKEVEFMSGSYPNIYWRFCWKWLSPILIIVVLLSSCIKKMIVPETYESYVGCTAHPLNPEVADGTETWLRDIAFPWWGQMLAALLVCAPIIWIPICCFLGRNAPVPDIPMLEGMEEEGYVVENHVFDWRTEVQEIKTALKIGQNGQVEGTDDKTEVTAV